MSRLRRFGGHRRLSAFFKVCGSMSTSRGGFPVSVVFGFYMRPIFACAWLRGIAGPKKRLSTLY